MHKKRDLAAGKTWDEMLDWFRRMTGRIIWVGVSWSQHEEIHGYHHWTVMKVDRTENGVDFVLFSDPVTQNQWRVPVEFAWKAAEEEPGPGFRDYERQWGRGLEGTPTIAEVLKGAGLAQQDQQPRGIAGGKSLT